MREFWAKDIVNARLKFKEGDFEGGFQILKNLLESKNPDCVRESKKLLSKTLIQLDDRKEMAKQYLEDLFKEEKNIQLAVDLMILSSNLGKIQDIKIYYDESVSLLDNAKTFNRFLLNYLYFSSLVDAKVDFNDAFKLISNLVKDFKEIGVLDHHFLVTRNFPSFYEFIKKTEKLYLDNEKEAEFTDFLKKQILWVDESGKEIINEFLENHPNLN